MNGGRLLSIKTCCCCGIVLDRLSKSDVPNFCMWCYDRYDRNRDKIHADIEQLLDILTNFVKNAKSNWQGSNHGKAAIGNIIIGSIRDIANKYDIPIEHKISLILKEYR